MRWILLEWKKIHMGGMPFTYVADRINGVELYLFIPFTDM